MDVSTFLRLMRASQQRAWEVHGTPIPVFSVWDPLVPDARVRDPKKRGHYYSRQYGAMSAMYCIACGQRSPYAVSETMAKAVYKCLKCVQATGHPRDWAMIPGTGCM